MKISNSLFHNFIITVHAPLGSLRQHSGTILPFQDGITLSSNVDLMDFPSREKDFIAAEYLLSFIHLLPAGNRNRVHSRF